ncbi:MAG: hypothetical protein AB7G21_11360 [Dehalococcoidia bacterium]
MTTIRCPMIECRRRIDLDAIPVPPEQPAEAPCLHYLAAWDRPGGRLGPMAEAVLWGLRGNRELAIRSVRPAEVAPERIDETRELLEAVAAEFAHEVTEDGAGALFGDVFERDRVSFAFAQIILGPDPMAPR